MIILENSTITETSSSLELESFIEPEIEPELFIPLKMIEQEFGGMEVIQPVSTITEVSSSIDSIVEKNLYDFVELDLDIYKLGVYKDVSSEHLYRLTRMSALNEISKIEKIDYPWLSYAQHIANKKTFLANKGIIVLDDSIFDMDYHTKNNCFVSTITLETIFSGDILIVPSEEAVELAEATVDLAENISVNWKLYLIIAIVILIIGVILYVSLPLLIPLISGFISEKGRQLARK